MRHEDSRRQEKRLLVGESKLDTRLRKMALTTQDMIDMLSTRLMDKTELGYRPRNTKKYLYQHVYIVK